MQINLLETIHWLTTPIFFLTPYIALWSVLIGAITVALLRPFKLELSVQARASVWISASLASMLWNWSIGFNGSTPFLNVDHPILRISWADALNAVCVFAAVSSVVGWFTARDVLANLVARVAGLAALVTVLADTFLF
jgi:cell division protein FtsX